MKAWHPHRSLGETEFAHWTGKALLYLCSFLSQLGNVVLDPLPRTLTTLFLKDSILESLLQGSLQVRLRYYKGKAVLGQRWATKEKNG